MRHLSSQWTINYQPRTLKKEIMELFIALKRIPKKDETQVKDLKDIRRIMKCELYIVTVTHKKSKIAFTKKVDQRLRGEKFKQLMSEARVYLKQMKVTKSITTAPVVKDFYGAKLELVGGVHKEKNSIVKADRNNKKNDPKITKKPVLPKNYLGIEIEFNDQGAIHAEQEEIRDALMAANLGKHCNLVQDGSCGHELRVLLTEDNYKKPLIQIVKLIKKLGYSANSSCGLHVHLDMRNRDHKKVYKNLFSMQKLMFKLIPTQRRTNSYCRPNTAPDFDAAVNNGDRYWYINAQAYSRHKTLEVRLHHGTLNTFEILSWLKILIKIANYDSEIGKTIETTADAVASLPFDSTEQKMIERRFRKFNAA